MVEDLQGENASRPTSGFRSERLASEFDSGGDQTSRVFGGFAWAAADVTDRFERRHVPSLSGGTEEFRFPHRAGHPSSASSAKR
jgi:hypothetical protein